jgi:hypothetical protein
MGDLRRTTWAGTIAGTMAVLALCAACSSKPSRKPAAGDVALGAIPWSEMVGLTQDQIRLRLGLRRTGETFATQGVRLDVGQVVAETPVRDLARTPCGRERKDMVARTSFSHQAVMTFVNGRLTAINGLEPGGPPMDAEHPLRAVCKLVPEPKQAKPPRRSTREKVVAAVKWGMMAPDRTEEEQRNFVRWQTIGDLHLGGTPPGGVETWTRLHGDAASLASLPAERGDAEIVIRTGGRIVLRNGLVSAIEPEDPDASCLLRPDMSLACDQKRFYSG